MVEHRLRSLSQGTVQQDGRETWDTHLEEWVLGHTIAIKFKQRTILNFVVNPSIALYSLGYYRHNILNVDSDVSANACPRT